MKRETTVSTEENRPRGVAYARVFTGQREPIHPADLSEALYGRGFLPGFTDPEAKTPPLADAGLADARFTPGSEGYRILSMTSSRGNGCTIRVDDCTEADLPDEYLARRAVPRPRLVYLIEAGGLSHSDRNLCENMAEALMLQTNGLVVIGGLGVKGNRPRLYTTSWIGSIKAMG
jgi:hypothetical protein